MEKKGALQNIRVLDLGQFQAAPLCAAMLGDLGADVIKLEIPVKGEMSRTSLPLGGYFAVFNRSKRGITMDLKKGRELFLELIKSVDVVIENFRPGVMERLGLGYDVLKEVNPSLIYCAVSGFGQKGPYAKRAALDPLAQGMGGIMSVTGFPGQKPTRCGAAICDVMGAMNATIGILAALNYRNITGEGQMVDIALVDGAAVAMSSVNQVYLSGGKVPGRLGNSYTGSAPAGVYATKDGHVIIFPLWEVLCQTMGREELINDPRFDTIQKRLERTEELDEIIEAWTSTMTTEELMAAAPEKGFVVGPVMTIDQITEDPQVAGVREMFPEVELENYGKFRITGNCIKLSKTPPVITNPPTVGQHNEEIYGELGFTAEQLENYKADGII